MHATDFETDAATSLAGMQRSLRQLVDALPQPPSTATGLERALGVDRNLAWKVHRLVTTSEPAAIAGLVPGRAAMQLVVDAARRLNVPGSVLDGILDAEARYREMIRRHAGDRASAALMLGASAAADGTSVGSGGAGSATGGVGSGAGVQTGTDLGLRRAAFRAMSFLAGVRVGTQLSTFLVAPGSDAERVDVVSIKGFYDIERIRAGAPFVMTRPRAAVGGAAYATMMQYTGIEPVGASGATDVPLVPAFCSHPTPRFKALAGDEGFVEDHLEDRPVGKTGACTVVRATVSRNLLPRYKSTGDEHAEVSTRLRTPCQVVILDKFIHADAYGDVTPTVRVYNDLAGEAAWVGERQASQLVPAGERVQLLGRGITGVRDPAAPRYEALLAHAFERLGWDPAKFTGYRVRVELPLIPSTVMLVHPQLDR